MSEGFRLRVKYRIGGRLAFLSHLETIRSMERIVRRAALPFAITEGFNPHMKVAFGPALPVGAGSRGEYLDVRLLKYVAPDIALEALQANAPENLMPIACEYIAYDADAIDVAFPVSVWEAEITGASIEELEAAFEKLLERGFIEVVKKKGRKETVKRVSFEARLIEDPVFTENDTCVAVRFTTYQGSEGALRPDKFIAAATEQLVESPYLRSLTRLELRPA